MTKQGRGQRWVDAKTFHLTDEVRHMQRRAAERRGPIVTIGPLLLFSTDSGDAWILDPADHLSTRIAEEGVPRPVQINETEPSFVVGWQGTYEILGTAFVFSHLESGRVTTISAIRRGKSPCGSRVSWETTATTSDKLRCGAHRSDQAV